MITAAQLAVDIAAEHAAVEAAGSGALDHARRCGELLIAAKRRKDEIPHGQWIAFLTGCGVTTRTAQEYMQVARGWNQIQQKRGTVAHLSLRQALAMLRPAKDDRRDRPVPAVHWKDCSDAVRRELRRIAAEMAEFPFERHVFLEKVRSGSALKVIPGCAGAPVYWDICGGDPDTGRPLWKYTRSQVTEKLAAFIDGGPRSTVSDLAVDVAQRRLSGDRTLSRPVLPPDEMVTVTLSAATVAQIRMLADKFGTDTPDETVATAIEFAHFYYSVDVNESDSLTVSRGLVEAGAA